MRRGVGVGVIAALLLFACTYLAGNPELGVGIVVFAALPVVVFAAPDRRLQATAPRKLRAMGER